MPKELGRLAGVLHESTVLSAVVDSSAREVRMRLAVLAHPVPGSRAQPEVTVVLREVGRLAGWLRKLERMPDPSQGDNVVRVEDVYPPVIVGEVGELNQWLDRFGGIIYAQPDPMFDRPDDPTWLQNPSFDFGHARTAQHNLEVWFDGYRAADNHRLDLRIWFQELQILDESGREMTPEHLVEAVRQWWNDMHEGRTDGQYGIVPGPSS